MRYAIISDIHSNLPAFEAVLEKIDALGIDAIICLGDIVGYNAEPNECVDEVISRNIRCIMGNHDSRACGLEEPDNFTVLAKEAVLWTRNELNQKGVLFLKTLSRFLTFDNNRAVAVHGFVNDTDRYITTASDAYENFKLMKIRYPDAKVCFFGHTHCPVIFKLDHDNVTRVFAAEIRLDSNRLYLINPGAVGQPRDGNPQASFLLYAPEEKEVRFFRVRYDIMKTADKVLNAGLPILFAQRLKTGY